MTEARRAAYCVGGVGINDSDGGGEDSGILGSGTALHDYPPGAATAIALPNGREGWPGQVRQHKTGATKPFHDLKKMSVTLRGILKKIDF